MAGRCAWLALLLLALFPLPAWAVIETLMSLDKFERDADLILVAKIDQLDLAQGRMVLTVERALKGKFDTVRLPVKLAGNANEALAGLSAGNSVVLFINRGERQDLAYAYADGAWFLILGLHDQDKTRWQFKDGEPYLRRSYSDETSQLVELLTAKLAGTGELPGPDATIPPGYGLIVGKHPAPKVLGSSSPATSPATAENGASTVSPPIFNRNVLLAIAGTGCVCVFAFMLMRSVPVEDADA